MCHHLKFHHLNLSTDISSKYEVHNTKITDWCVTGIPHQTQCQIITEWYLDPYLSYRGILHLQVLPLLEASSGVLHSFGPQGWFILQSFICDHVSLYKPLFAHTRKSIKSKEQYIFSITFFSRNWSWFQPYLLHKDKLLFN